MNAILIGSVQRDLKLNFFPQTSTITSTYMYVIDFLRLLKSE